MLYSLLSQIISEMINHLHTVTQFSFNMIFRTILATVFVWIIVDSSLTQAKVNSVGKVRKGASREST